MVFSAAVINWFDAFLNRCRRYGCCPHDFPNISDLFFSDADDQLFSRIWHNVTHVLKPLFPTQTQHSYNLRDRRHNFVLIEKNSQINYRHFIISVDFYSMNIVLYLIYYRDELPVLLMLVIVDVDQMSRSWWLPRWRYLTLASPARRHRRPSPAALAVDRPKTSTRSSTTNSSSRPDPTQFHQIRWSATFSKPLPQPSSTRNNVRHLLSHCGLTVCY